MITIWGRLSSINVQKAVWCLDELGLAYERRDAGGAFEIVDSPEYLRINPNGLVPTFEEDGFVLWESNAIVRYLAARDATGTLWPADPRRRADADRWMDWQTTTTAPAIRDAFWQLVRTRPEERDATLIARSLEAGERVASILDAHLSGRDFVAGKSFTVGDIATGAFAHRWLGLPASREHRPNLVRWYEALRTRPGASQVLGLPIT